VHYESLGSQPTTSMKVLETSICTFLGGLTHVGRSMTFEIQKSFLLLFLLFSLLSSGIILACQNEKVSCYFFFVKFDPHYFDYYLFFESFY